MNQDNFDRILTFLHSIAIEVQYHKLNEDTFLPGLLIDNGHIVIDMEKLKYPGDILHEAGHIAIVPKSDRATLSASELATRKDSPAEEMMAIAWSYAACRHLEIDPYFVFHEHGYKGSGKEIADQFNAGNYFGVPMLQWTGMAAGKNSDPETNQPPYPAMIKWLRDA